MLAPAPLPAGGGLLPSPGPNQALALLNPHAGDHRMETEGDVVQ